MLRGGDNV